MHFSLFVQYLKRFGASNGVAIISVWAMLGIATPLLLSTTVPGELKRDTRTFSSRMCHAPGTYQLEQHVKYSSRCTKRHEIAAQRTTW